MTMIQTRLAGSHPEPQMGPRSVSDSDSDSDSPASGGGRTMADDPARSQVIHSGHFMVSSPHSDLAPRRHHQQADPPGIDPTLTRLFECMSLAYSGKLVSPKWKNFKGLRLLCRDKIRLNNAIWRAWYIQYVAHRKSAVCGFVTPLDGSEADEHRKPEAVVLEGNYWKRRIEVVMEEYHKWRIYYKKRLHRFSREGEITGPKTDEGAGGPRDRWCSQLFSNVVPMLLRDKEEEDDGRQHFDLDSFLSDISDTLFTMTQGCYPPQPSPDEVYAGNADMIQPELTPLQPNLDDFMEISDFLSSPRPLLTPSLASYQDQPCFAPVSETLFGSSAGANLLPPGAADSLLPSANPPGPPLAHLQPAGGCSAPLGAPGVFLRPYLTPTPPVSTPASGFSLDLKAKPPGAPRAFPNKWLSLDPYSPFCPAGPLPGAPLLAGQDCPLSSSAPRAKPLYPPSTLFSCPPPSSGLPTPCFAHSMPSYGDMDLTPGYQVPFGPSSYLCPGGGPSRPSPGPVRGQPQQPGVGQRPPIKEANGKAKRLLRLAGSPLIATPNPCLTQLLITAKPEPSLEGLLPPPTQISAPMEPESVLNAFRGEEPAGLLPRFSRLSPHLSPSASPSPSIVASGPSATVAVVPKTERLSPTPVCGSNPKSSGQRSPTSPERLVSTPFYSSSRSKKESNKTESRRITHISAEQKRRFNIKLGFDTLHGLVSTLSAQPSLKVSKATTLQKTAEYIGKLQQERSALQEEAQRLRDQIEELNVAINLCQQQLPATGVPITRQRFDQMRSMFDEYVRSCTLQNWKFWVFSLIMRPLFESFNGMVSTSSLQSLSQTSLAWLDQYCSLPALRPTVLSSLRQLSVSTSILTNPAGIPEQAAQAVMGRGPGDVSS